MSLNKKYSLGFAVWDFGSEGGWVSGVGFEGVGRFAVALKVDGVWGLGCGLPCFRLEAQWWIGGSGCCHG